MKANEDALFIPASTKTVLDEAKHALEKLKRLTSGAELLHIVRKALDKIPSNNNDSNMIAHLELMQGIITKQYTPDLWEALQLILGRLPPEPPSTPDKTKANYYCGLLKEVIRAHHNVYSSGKFAKQNYRELESAVKWLLDGVNPLGQDDAIDYELLNWSAHNVDLFQKLLASGANPNPKPSEGKQLLITALTGNYKNKIEVLELLAPHYTKSQLGSCLLDTSVEGYCCNGTQIRTLVQNCGADVNHVCPKTGATPLLHAASHRYEGCVEVLLEAGAKQQCDNRGMTPLMAAAEAYHEGDLEIDRLVEAGADVNARDHKGHTALHYAFQNGSISEFLVVQALLRHGAHGNCAPDSGLLERALAWLEDEDEFEFEDEEVDYFSSSHRLHVLLLRATLPVLPGGTTSNEYKRVKKSETELGHTLATTCLEVHQAHFRHAIAIFVGARSCIQLLRSFFSGVDSPVAKALVAAYSAEERAAARALPMTAIHRPRFPVHIDHVQSESTLQSHSSAMQCEDVLNMEEAAQRVARFAFDLAQSAALPANQRNQCGLQTAIWFTYLNIPLETNRSSSS